ncbi:MAG: DUF1499 domain-containing protein [Phormidesmis sp.]
MKSVLSTFLSTCLTIALSALVCFGSPMMAIAQPQIATLPGLKGVFASERPANLGVKSGSLAGCPTTPNCVVSQGADEDHAIAPIRYVSDRATARQSLINILGVVPRTKIIEQSDDYVLAQSESRLMGFVDDTEFYFPKDEKVIHARAAARLGESDLGVNRRRIEQIRLAFQDLAQRNSERDSASSMP